jgi:L-malate glycosyltransferase
MRVGMVCYPTIGGSGIVATELGHELAKRGHEVHFITYEPPIRLQSDLPGIFFHQVQIAQYDLFKYPDYGLALAVKIAELAPTLDLLHVHYAVPHATSAYLAKQMVPTPPLITTLHGTDITLIGQAPPLYELVKFSLQQSDAITAVSQSLKTQTLDTFKLDLPIEVIPNFVSPKPPAKPSGPTKTLLHASNFRPVKRIQDVIATFARIHAKVPSRLILVGEGPELPAMRRLAQGLPVEFVGGVHSIDPYLAQADLFLLPSEQESFGLAALEAMAAAIPVIATNTGGLPELITDGETGFLTPAGDIDQMAARALKILTDPTLQQKMGSAARQTATTRFAPDPIVEQYLRVAESLA